MIQLKNILKTKHKGSKNWKIDTTPKALNYIHNEDINITIYERDIRTLTDEIHHLLEQNIKLSLSGDVNSILENIKKAIPPSKYGLIIQDIEKLLLLFGEVTGSTEFRLLLATINTNMCRRFHTDVNDVRMLCTYSGPGTLWLTDDNINQEALRNNADNTHIVLKEKKIQKAKTGAVILLKGAMYPQEKVKAIVHRSPTIEESGEKRLLLRVDTNNTLNF